MSYEDELEKILLEAFGPNYQKGQISKESIHHLVEILELKLNKLVGNINIDEYFNKENEINMKYIRED